VLRDSYLLNRHHDLDCVETIQTQVVREVRGFCDLLVERKVKNSSKCDIRARIGRDAAMANSRW